MHTNVKFKKQRRNWAEAQLEEITLKNFFQDNARIPADSGNLMNLNTKKKILMQTGELQEKKKKKHRRSDQTKGQTAFKGVAC